ncbi:MAG: hypothetical protein KAS32_10590 [Candidatus Peribacteraceae bacterium]|nr:hypothetical protein [Candidatus Peribacteraceae bacterium]
MLLSHLKEKQVDWRENCKHATKLYHMTGVVEYRKAARFAQGKVRQLTRNIHTAEKKKFSP